MAPVTTFSIAGIGLQIASADESLQLEPWPCYREFEVDGAQSADTSIKLRLVVKPVPEISHVPAIFEGPSWSMFRSRTENWISLARRPDGSPPLWAAQLSPDFRQGTVYCDPGLLNEKGGKQFVVNPVLHRLDQILLMYALAEVEGAILHGTGVIAEGKGYAFLGRSGAGKTTLARLIEEGASPRVRVISDDRVIVRRHQATYTLYGTPWPGEAQIARNEKAPLAAVLFLQHGAEERLTRLEPAEALTELVPVISIPWFDRPVVERLMAWCDRFIREVPMWRFEFRPVSEVWKFLQSFFQSLEGASASR